MDDYAKRLRDWWTNDSRSEIDSLKQANVELIKQRDASYRACDRLKTEVDSLRIERAAFVEQWESLRDENAKLKAEVSTSRHVQHCYEQCEADRQALAKERDAAVAESKRLQDAVWELEETNSATESERNQFLNERDEFQKQADEWRNKYSGLHAAFCDFRADIKNAVEMSRHVKETKPASDFSRVESGMTATLDAEVERPTPTFPATPKPKFKVGDRVRLAAFVSGASIEERRTKFRGSIVAVWVSSSRPFEVQWDYPEEAPWAPLCYPESELVLLSDDD